MVDNPDFSDDLTPEQEKLIAALLTEKSKRDAARKAQVPETTMYRWLRDPAFLKVYRAARWQSFEEAIAMIQVASPAAAAVVISGIGKKAKLNEAKAKLALAILDRAFTAHQHIGIEQEFDRLREKEERMTAMMATAPPIADTGTREVVMTNIEQGEADRLRVKWMGLVGHGHENIDVSLRYNRPESVAEEREYLRIVEEMIEEEKKYPPEHRSMPVPSMPVGVT